MVAPVIPALDDHELPSVLAPAGAAGASFAGAEILRLPLTAAPIFVEWFERDFRARKDKVLNRIRDIHGGRLNGPRLGHRMGLRRQLRRPDLPDVPRLAAESGPIGGWTGVVHHGLSEARGATVGARALTFKPLVCPGEPRSEGCGACAASCWGGVHGQVQRAGFRFSCRGCGRFFPGAGRR
jgi:hypothetical protein